MDITIKWKGENVGDTKLTSVESVSKFAACLCGESCVKVTFSDDKPSLVCHEVNKVEESQ